MRADTVRFPLLWGLREALWPLGLLVAVLWVAGPALTVSWSGPFESAPPPSKESPPSSTELHVPVQGVAPSSLRDSFTDPRSGGRAHHAIDIPAARGTPVVAATDGIILKTPSGGLGGRSVYQLSADSTYAFYYAHLSRIASGISSGSTVSAGDVIGFVGATGNATTNHLHFAVWALDDLQPPWSDRPVNPYPLLTNS